MVYLEPANEMAHYFNNPKFSDVTIHFSGHEVKAHKVILASHSAYFRKMFESEFVEGSAKDVHLYEDDPEVIFGLLAYLYGCSYGGDREDCGCGIMNHVCCDGEYHKLGQLQHLDYHVKLCAAADKYGVSSLVDVATESFHQGMQKLEQRHAEMEKKQSAIHLVIIALLLAKLLYHDLGDRVSQLRPILAKAVHRRAIELKQCRTYALLLDEVPQFAVDLLGLATDATIELQKKCMDLDMAIVEERRSRYRPS